jgi:hypothetical protein
LSDFNEAWIFWKKFRKIFQWKSVQWEPSWEGRTDGQAEMTTQTAAFRNCVNAPKNDHNFRHAHELLKAHVLWAKHAKSEASTTNQPYYCSINGVYPKIPGYFPSLQRRYNQYVRPQLVMINRYLCLFPPVHYFILTGSDRVFWTVIVSCRRGWGGG